jgi:RNA polymerase sigma-70 factor (ECF subfamily)
VSDLDQHLSDISAGDPDAFASWVAAAEPRLRASLASFATRVDTEAVLQECLLRVWQTAPRFEHDGRPDGLLRLGIRIARNLAVSEMRRRRVRLAHIEQLAQAAATAQNPPTESSRGLAEIVEKCRERLPPKPRAALDMRLEGEARPDADLAAALGMKLNTFLQNIRRARLHLAECLKRHGIRLGGET